jgi:hypothetical protein
VAQAYELDWNGDEVEVLSRAGATEGLTVAAEYLLGEARKVVPLEEGTLERSGVAQVDEATLTGAVSFDTVYAVYQHEELGLRHAPGRTAKYLETPAIAKADVIRDLIAARIRRALRS